MAHSGFEELYRSRHWQLSAGPMKNQSEQAEQASFEQAEQEYHGIPWVMNRYPHDTMEHFLLLALEKTLKLIHGKVSIIFTGHSLGGACASLMAFDTSYQLQTHICRLEECNRQRSMHEKHGRCEHRCEHMVDGEHKVDEVDGELLKKLKALGTCENTLGKMSLADRVSKHVKCYTFGQPMAFCIPYFSKSQSINSMLPGS